MHLYLKSFKTIYSYTRPESVLTVQASSSSSCCCSSSLDLVDVYPRLQGAVPPPAGLARAANLVVKQSSSLVASRCCGARGKVSGRTRVPAARPPRVVDVSRERVSRREERRRGRTPTRVAWRNGGGRASLVPPPFAFTWADRIPGDKFVLPDADREEEGERETIGYKTGRCSLSARWRSESGVDGIFLGSHKISVTWMKRWLLWLCVFIIVHCIMHLF